MTIGLDLDNTIVCYDASLRRLAMEFYGMPDAVAVEKNAVRQFFRDQSRERDWTALQGVAYGRRMTDASAFPGALDFVRQAVAAGHEIYIVSHRTRHPVIGDGEDLHELALDWLGNRGIVGGELIGRECVYFAETREEKISRIRRLACDVFLDDLPEVLSAPEFPAEVSRFLFSPGGDKPVPANTVVVADWGGFGRQVLR